MANSRLTYRRGCQHNIHVRGYKEKGNINTPLELLSRIKRIASASQLMRSTEYPASGYASRRPRGVAQSSDRRQEPRSRVWHRSAGHYELAVAVLIQVTWSLERIGKNNGSISQDSYHRSYFENRRTVRTRPRQVYGNQGSARAPSAVRQHCRCQP